MAHWQWELLLLSVCFSGRLCLIRFQVSVCRISSLQLSNGFSLFTECRSQETVDQPQTVLMAFEGGRTTLNCTYKTTDSFPYLFWYQQKSNDFPRYMVKIF